ncbi:amidohydrolase family protein [Microlunatus sp. Y2014]|uniref:amidohydrolase family protein n=1 Tax=Microlunatus sp. Y2014 TaxID=3418488 RepID=UPI003DA76355
MIIDVAAYVGTWPFRDLPGDPETVAAVLTAAGVTTAYASPVEAALHAAPHVANRRLADQLAGHDLLRFVPVVNPILPDGLAQVESWADAAAIRLHPGPHGYELPAATEVVRRAGELSLPVLVHVRFWDQRMSHRNFVSPETGADPVVELAKACPQTSVIAVGARNPEIITLATAGCDNLRADVSMAESINVLRMLIEACGADRLMCGTQAPLLVPGALAAKLDGVDLTEQERVALTYDNAVAAGLPA